MGQGGTSNTRTTLKPPLREKAEETVHSSGDQRDLRRGQDADHTVALQEHLDRNNVGDKLGASGKRDEGKVSEVDADGNPALRRSRCMCRRRLSK